MNTQAFLLHALSPLHAGVGHAAEVIDLPIARMQSTGIPLIPGSTLKGVLRDARQREHEEHTEAVFGPGKAGESSLHAGAIMLSDARLLALPVRSFRGTFAWVSSPLLLQLALRDLGDVELRVPKPAASSALVSSSELLEGQKLYLEDIDLHGKPDDAAKAWARWLRPHVCGDAADADYFSSRFALVDDETMTFLWETATQVDARVRLSNETRTVARGALWLEESLPPETLLIGLAAADRSRRAGVDLSPEQVLQFALPPGEQVLQLGGKASVGRGRCRVVPLPSQGAAQ